MKSKKLQEHENLKVTAAVHPDFFLFYIYKKNPDSFISLTGFLPPLRRLCSTFLTTFPTMLSMECTVCK